VAVTETPVTGVRPNGGAVRKPRRSRYVFAATLLLGGLALALGVGFGGSQTKSDLAVGFVRVTVPGALTLQVGQPATYYVYSEGTACLDYPNCHGQLYPVTVKVTDPTGNPVRVEPTNGPTYMIGGSGGTGVARFDAITAGSYRVAASTGSYSEGTIAVGKAFPTWTQDWIAWLAMVLLWVGGVLIIVLPIVRYRRRRQTSCPECGSTVHETFCEVCGYDLVQKTRDEAHFPYPGPR
jgi:hypothetical protein